jgi:hypothetical protein
MGFAILVAPIFLQRLHVQVMSQGNENRFCGIAAYDFENVPSL